MDPTVRHELKTATHHVLRAHDFSKCSSAATDIIVDLLSRFLELVATSTGEYAELAGRSSANVFDGISALEEVGLGVEETLRWCRRDGPDLGKYRSASPTNRSALADSLKVGVRHDEDDYTLFRYIPVEYPPPDSDSNSEDGSQMLSPTLIPSIIDPDNIPSNLSRPHSPAFSPAPNAVREFDNMDKWSSLVSNHTHEFLPPLSEALAEKDSESTQDGQPTLPSQVGTSPQARKTSNPAGLNAINQPRRYNEKNNQHSLFLAKATEYTPSSTGHDLFPLLPDAPRRSASPASTPPSTHPFLLIALQSTQDAAQQAGTAANPSRLAISASLASASISRYTTSSSLFSSPLLTPPVLRSLAPAPSHAMPEDMAAPTVLLPPPVQRSIQNTTADSIDPRPLYAPTHLPTLSSDVVRQGVRDRSMLLAPPPPFVVEPGQPPLLYGRAAKAPWNKALAGQAGGRAGAGGPGDRPGILTDALLYATWPVGVKGPEDELRRVGTGGTIAVHPTTVPVASRSQNSVPVSNSLTSARLDPSSVNPVAGPVLPLPTLGNGS